MYGKINQGEMMKNKKMMKRLLTFIVMLVIIVYSVLELTTFSVKRVEIDVQQRALKLLPQSFDGLSVVFFSDIHFNNFMDSERLNPFIDTINSLNPDLILFGGDLFDHPSVDYPNEHTIEQLTQLLSTLNAPYGKYAVLGNHDHESTTTKNLTISLLHDAGFTTLINESIQLYHPSGDFINLVGIDSQLLGNPDIEKAYSNIETTTSTITLSHTPDIIDQLDHNLTQWQLSGHSHGGQISLPFYGPVYKVPYAEKFPTSQADVRGIILDVSNGVGTTRLDMRLFANPQIHYFTLKGVSNDASN